MGLLELIIILALVGFVAWIVLQLIPMPAPFPKIIVAVACLLALLIVLRAIGFDLPVPRVR